MKRVEKAWARLYRGRLISFPVTWVGFGKTKPDANTTAGGDAIVRVTLTYDDGTKPKKRKAKR